MGNLLFSPNGRMGPKDFFTGIMILSVISAVISLLPLISYTLYSGLSLLTLVLIVPFVFLLMKRSRDAGRSGWMSIAWVLLYIVLFFIMGTVLPIFFGGENYAEMQAATQEAMAEGGFGALMEVAEVYGEAVAVEMAIPNAIATLVLGAVFAALVNLLNKQEPHDNRFGPVPA